MGILSFYDVDKNYVDYLKQVEIKERGFSCVPDIEYGGNRKFLCGVVLEVNEHKYYVPVTSYRTKQSENILIVIGKDKHNNVKGSLRFNYMFPVPENCITERIIKNEPDSGRRIFLNAQLRFCISNAKTILNQAKRTYLIVTRELNEGLLSNSCMFKLLEAACAEYEADLRSKSKNPNETHK